jgi:hypothetical protein
MFKFKDSSTLSSGLFFRTFTFTYPDYSEETITQNNKEFIGENLDIKYE